MSLTVRTGRKDDPERNLQLHTNEVQLEGERGKISVYTFPDKARVAVTVQDGDGQKSVVVLTREQLAFLVYMIREARADCTQREMP